MTICSIHLMLSERECREGDKDQLFYLNIDHGPTNEPTLNRSNVDVATDAEKKRFRNQDFPYKNSVTGPAN